MDPDSARLALDLQIQDIDDVLSTLNAGSEAAAFRSFRAELMKKMGEVEGQVVALRMLRHEHGTREVHLRLLGEERQAQGDHAMASRLAGRAPTPQPDIPRNDPPGERDQALDRVTPEVPLVIDLGVTQTEYAHPTNPKKRCAGEDSDMLGDKTAGSAKRRLDVESNTIVQSDVTPDNVITREEPLAEAASSIVRLPPRSPPSRPESISAEEKDETNVGEDSQVVAEEHDRRIVNEQVDLDAQKNVDVDAPGGETQEAANRAECWGCFEELDEADILKLPCPIKHVLKHAFCRNCLQSIFEHAITDPYQFPPRCCEPLDLAHCIDFLSEDVVAKYREKKEELETSNRIYCSKVECGKWIRPESIEAGVATCPACTQTTCATCKQKQHEGLCPDDPDVKTLLALSNEKRWKSCPQCKNMIELSSGCYHITCRCKHQFCYLCQAAWKTCRCTKADQQYVWPGAPAEANAAAVANRPAAYVHNRRRRNRR